MYTHPSGCRCWLSSEPHSFCALSSSRRLGQASSWRSSNSKLKQHHLSRSAIPLNWEQESLPRQQGEREVILLSTPAFSQVMWLKNTNRQCAHFSNGQSSVTFTTEIKPFLQLFSTRLLTTPILLILLQFHFGKNHYTDLSLIPAWFRIKNENESHKSAVPKTGGIPRNSFWLGTELAHSTLDALSPETPNRLPQRPFAPEQY